MKTRTSTLGVKLSQVLGVRFPSERTCRRIGSKIASAGMAMVIVAGTLSALVVVSTATPAVAAAQSSPSSPLTWTQQAGPGGGYIGYSVSCVSSTWCMYNDLVGTASIYEAGTIVNAGETGVSGGDVSCVSTTLCVSVGPSNVGAAAYSVWNGSTWDEGAFPTTDIVEGGTNQLTCVVGGTSCVVVGGDTSTGNGWIATYTISSGTWSYSDEGGTGSLYTVSCSSSTACVATGSFSPSETLVLSGSTWSVEDSGSSPTGTDQFLSCPTSTFCMETRDSGIYSTWNGTSWSTTSSGLIPSASSITCTSASFCMDVEADSTAYVWNGSSWSSLTVPGSNTIIGISCTSVLFCLGVGNGPQLFSVQTFNGFYWTSYDQTSYVHQLTDVSCTSTTFCVTVGDFNPGSSQVGLVGVYDGVRWSYSSVPSTTLISSISCVSSSFCRAVGTDSSQDLVSLTYNGSAWSALQTISDPESSSYHMAFASTSCTSSTFCATTYQYEPNTGSGSIYLSYTMNGTSWTSRGTVTDSTSDPNVSVSCTSTSFCMGDFSGSAYVFSGSSWSAGTATSGVTYGSISCVLSTFCMASGMTPTGDIYAYNGSTWTEENIEDQQPPNGSGGVYTSVSCKSSSYCVGYVLPTDSAQGGYQVAVFNGTGWSIESGPPVYGSGSVSCPAVGSCVIAGYNDAIWGAGFIGVDNADDPQGGPVSPAELYGGSNPSEPGLTSGSGGPVDPMNGDFTAPLPLASAPASNPGLGFTISYDSVMGQNEVSSGAAAPADGWGWSDGASPSLSYNTTTSEATVTQENGSQVAFNTISGTSPDGSCTTTSSLQCYVPSTPRDMATLAKNLSTSVWTLSRDGGAETFTFGTPSGMTIPSGGPYPALTTLSGQYTTTFTYGVSPGTSPCPLTSGVSKCTVQADPSGRSLVLAYNSSGNLIEVVNSGAQVWTFTYTSGNLMSITDPGASSASFSFTYDTSNSDSVLVHDMLTLVDATRGTTTNTYFPSGGSGPVGAINTEADPTNGTTTYVYTGNNESDAGGTTTGTDQSGDVTQFDYTAGVFGGAVDLVGTGLQSSNPVGWDQATLESTVTFDPDGHKTTNTYDAQGNLLSSTDGAGNTTTSVYNSNNQAWCTVDAAEIANGVTCPSSEPSMPSSGSSPSSYADPGVTLNYYNSFDELIGSTDPLGNTTSNAYTASGSGVPVGLQFCSVDAVEFAASKTCPSSYSTTHNTGTSSKTFNSYGDVKTSTDAVGNVTSTCYYYETSGCASSAPSLVTGESNTLLYSTTDPDGSVTTFQYNAKGETTVQTVTFGSYAATTDSSYDSAGRLYCTVSPLEVAASVTCPSSYSSMSASSPPVNVTSTFYNSVGQITQSTGPTGATTLNAYDSAGHKYCTVAPAAAESAVTCPSVSFTTPTQTSDSYLGTTLDQFYSSGKLEQETNPAGGITTYTYDAGGNVASKSVEGDTGTGDPTQTTSYTYDGDNMVLTTTVGTSSTITTKNFYDPNGNVYCSVSGVAYATGLYNSSTNTGGYQCPTWKNDWIALGSDITPATVYSNTPTSNQAKGVTTSFYDADTHLVQQTTADQSTSATLFDGNGASLCTSDPNNTSLYLTAHSSTPYPYGCSSSAGTGFATSSYDAAGHMTSSTDANGNTTTTTYDPDGNTLVVTVPGSAVTSNCYYYETSGCAASAPSSGGSASMLYWTTSPPTQADSGGLITKYTYKPGGITATKTTPADVATNVYNADGTVASTTYSSVASGYTTPTNLSYTYYTDGSRDTVVDSSGETIYGYNASGQEDLSWFIPTTGTDQVVEYTYYPNGEGKTIQYPATASVSAPTVTYAYNFAGQEISMTDWNSKTTTFTPDANGNTTSTVFPNSTTSASTFNADSAVTAISAAPTGTPGSPFASQSYTRDANQQVSGETDAFSSPANSSSISPSYGYDGGNRLTSVNGTTVAYNSAGDATTQVGGISQSYDSSGELTSTGGAAAAAYTYNTNGGRTVLTPTGGATSTYGYNASNQMVSTATPNVPDNAPQTAAPSQSSGLVAAGLQHTLAVQSNGTVEAWGNNANGQLGNGTTTNSSTPVQVSGLSGVTQVAAGGVWQGFSAALTSSGNVYTWGSNSNGQLGHNQAEDGSGTTTDHHTPVEVQVSGGGNLGGIVAIAAGQDHMLALTSSGTVYSWGANYYGELGNAANTDLSYATPVSGLSSVLSISAGRSVSGAVTASGRVYLWGYNGDGELGISLSTGSANTPQELSNTTSPDITVPVTSLSISTGGQELALGADGSVWSWGDNTDGSFKGLLGTGNSSEANNYIPAQLSGISASAISAGGNQSLIEESDGLVASVGVNNDGELGNGTTTSSASPVTVTSAVDPSAIIAGGYTSYLLEPNGTLNAFGANNDGQLGNNTTVSSDVAIPSLWNETPGQVSASWLHSLVLTSAGNVEAFGGNANGQLGDGSTNTTGCACVDTPGEVEGVGGSGNLSNVVQVAAGGVWQGFSAALTSSGNVYTWGSNSNGQLGHNQAEDGSGTTTDSSTPIEVQVSGGGNLGGIVAIAAGTDQILALTSSGTVYAWGGDYYGELGNGATTDLSYATPISGLSNVVSISAGRSVSGAVTAAGAVYVWGYNGDGELATGSTSPGSANTPQLVSSSYITEPVTSLSISSGGQELALGADGKVWEWGDNTAGSFTGLLGTGSSAAYDATPAYLSGITATSISAGGNQSLIEETNGTVVSFGANGVDELGDGSSGGSGSSTPVTVVGVTNPAALSAGGFHNLVLEPNGTVNSFGEGGSGQLGNASTSDSDLAAPAGSLVTYTPSTNSATYTYNADGLRMTETTAKGQQVFAWNTVASVPQLLGDGTNSYLYGPDGKVVEQIDDLSNNPDYYVTDQLGSTRSLTDPNGSVVATYTYNALGQVTSHTGTASTPVQFGGGYTDPVTGLIYLQNRYLDPSTGVFLSVDPLVAMTGQPYIYAGNNPVNTKDLTGQSSVDLAGVANWALNNVWGTYNGYFDDCTDFVSRALSSGGHDPKNWGWDPPINHNDDHYWYKGTIAHVAMTSLSWVNAEHLANHLYLNGSYFRLYTKNATPGDIIFANWNNNQFSGIGHAGIVTGIANGQPTITQHSPSQSNVPLSAWLAYGKDTNVWVVIPNPG